ncbi:MAG TPA: VIT1/CCC1 transporter family protein, partial [Bryobacteraceae bacterium]|nr:VIT1/CCC1 transporter family protein [Bryobacteraceae bacterium]
IDEVPGGEREEIRQIFARKGFEGVALDHIVEVITRDRDLWVDTMITEELGLPLHGPVPIRAALATFAAFVVAGLVPLVPFLFSIGPGHRFLTSAIATGLAFWSVGMLKGRALERPILRSAFETLAIGSSAAVLAYVVGATLHAGFGG